jgi:hypothetical protein
VATNIAPIQGLIELQDNFTSQLNLAQVALSAFSKENQESLKAVSIAAGLVTAAYTAVMVATIEMGRHGADVADVDATLEHFAGSASAASDMMQKLREGTKGTVDNFTLAKDAAHLLSAGVKLTADDMGVLGQASFVLQNRGLGPTKDMLELVSNALVTGRTKALAMAVGVVDTGDAEERYAAKLGTTKDMLSLTGQAEAKRMAVMEILNKAVKDAGNQERDFGEQLEAARTKAVNFYDDLSKAVAQSPVFAAGMKAIGAAFQSAFGDDNTELVKTVVHWIEQAAIMGVNFGLAAIELARVVNVAWSAIKTVILGTETILLGVATTVLGTIEMVTTALASVPGAPTWIKETAVAAHDASTYMYEMTKSVAAETLEASKGLVGHSAFDATLDKLGGTLMNVKDAMVAASNETGKNAETTDIAANNAKKLAAAAAQVNASMLDQAKITEQLVKSTQELSAIWDDYFALVAKNSMTSGDAQRAQIEATFNKQVGALNALDPLFNGKYAAYRATADEALKGIGSDWDSVKDKSIEGMQQQADKAYKTYNEMVTSSYHFTREALDEQLAKYHTLQDAANGWGDTAKKAISETAATIPLLDHAWVTDADIAEATLNKTTIMVKTLTGEIISLTEAQRRQQMGGSTNINVANFAQQAQSFGLDIQAATALARKGYSFQGLMEILRGGNMSLSQIQNLPEGPGPRIPGFAEGGTVAIRTGENGPETVRVPLGSTVYPTGTPSTMMGGKNGDVYLTFQVNGTALQVAQQIKDIIMRELKSQRQFGAA